jgi:hypothetical protein
VNTRHEVLNWFSLSCGIIALRPVLIYYVVEIGFSLFLSGSFGGFPGCPLLLLDVDLSPLFIVREPTHIV